jgi:hypothetical protein
LVAAVAVREVAVIASFDLIGTFAGNILDGRAIRAVNKSVSAFGGLAGIPAVAGFAVVGDVLALFLGGIAEDTVVTRGGRRLEMRRRRENQPRCHGDPNPIFCFHEKTSF